ncbi:MAG: glycosyltransferase family 2 protein [Proteobacteria bacterium]|nr:glycosyltransferase family 2 protein [Pseudomonadota bacterium]
MLLGKRVTVIMPAYNAEKTLHQTYAEIPHDIVDHVILVDDCSKDKTVLVARELGIDVIQHDTNKGYGGNQKTCYQRACQLQSDIVVMLHPDYQYTPKLIRAMVSVIAEELYDVVLGSRILSGGALRGGMPVYKYISNRFLTFAENLLIGHKLSEYHTGFRAFRREVLERTRLDDNSDDFIFDNQMLVQCHALGYRIAEVTCPTKYFEEASSINFSRSLKYGFGCLWVGFLFFLHRTRLMNNRAFTPKD